MKTLAELAPDIDAGKLAILVWHDLAAFAFRDTEQYVLSSPMERCTWGGRDGESFANLLRRIDSPDEQDLSFFKQLIHMPLWTAIDPVMPGVDGVTLLSLHDKLNAGETAYCLLNDRQYPYKVEKNDLGEIWLVAPSPMNDVLSSYRTLEDLYAREFYAHLPVWRLGTSPAYRAIEEAYNREQEEAAREQAALDAMPARTIEMSEREYREWQDWKAREQRRIAALYAGDQDDFDPFLDPDPEEEKPANIVPFAFRRAFKDAPEF